MLIEKVNNGIGYGRTANYLPVAVHNVVQTNAIVNVTYSHECQADDHKSQ